MDERGITKAMYSSRHFYWSVISTQELLGEVKVAKFTAFLSLVIDQQTFQCLCTWSYNKAQSMDDKRLVKRISIQ